MELEVGTPTSYKTITKLYIFDHDCFTTRHLLQLMPYNLLYNKLIIQSKYNYSPNYLGIQLPVPKRIWNFDNQRTINHNILWDKNQRIYRFPHLKVIFCCFILETKTLKLPKLGGRLAILWGSWNRTVREVPEVYTTWLFTIASCYNTISVYCHSW